MEDLRRFKRHAIPLQVELIHHSTGLLRAQAKDMSEGGLFLLLDESFHLELGTEVTVRSLGLGPNGDECGPDIVMKVVRSCPEGMGLEIVRGQDTHEEEIIGQAKSTESGNRPFGRAILQRLLVVDDDEKVLLWHQGDHWHLPCRELQSHESWQIGLLACVSQLQTLGALKNSKQLETAAQCIPRNADNNSCIELLIPCRYLQKGEKNAAIADAIRWESLHKLPELGCMVDEQVMTSLTNQL